MFGVTAPATPQLRALFALPPGLYDVIYAGYPRAQLERRVEIIGGPLDASALSSFPRLHEVEVLFAGWQTPALVAELLDRMPALRAVFYGAGSIKNIVTEAFWERGIPVTSAYQANAVPVAEYTHAAIMLSLKRVWHFERTAQREQKWPAYVEMPGAFRSTVGLVSLGAIGRRVVEKLRLSDIQVVAYDPFVNEEVARQLGVRMLPLDELFRTADIVSLHTPWLKETEGLVTGALIETMKPNATLINTSRGAVIRENEMIEVLRRRPDLTALLDVTFPEPPVAGSPLYTLPNVVLTPHIAGSMGEECRRMGAYMVEELDRFLAGQPMKWQITREQAARMA